jgi:hypothetical protein
MSTNLNHGVSCSGGSGGLCTSSRQPPSERRFWRSWETGGCSGEGTCLCLVAFLRFCLPVGFSLSQFY